MQWRGCSLEVYLKPFELLSLTKKPWQYLPSRYCAFGNTISLFKCRSSVFSREQLENLSIEPLVLKNQLKISLWAIESAVLKSWLPSFRILWFLKFSYSILIKSKYVPHVQTKKFSLVTLLSDFKSCEIILLCSLVFEVSSVIPVE